LAHYGPGPGGPPSGPYAHAYGSAAPSPINVGDIVDKYRVEQLLGVGAMGVVAQGRHTTLDQVVAIKFLIEHKFGSAEESIARFLGEARAAAKIQSDYVCRVSDVGMLTSGIPYMIMEHLEGSDLEEELAQRGQLDLGEAVDFVLQALDAIAAAHSLGIVHRDLKPANLFLARRPDGSRRVKVLDFGISKAQGPSKQRFTRETKSLGTPAYMPPEQIVDPMKVDHRADIWALGAILYECITGQLAFVGSTVKEVLDRVLTEEPCPIPRLRGDVPPQLISIVQRALTRDRDNRWPSAATFARALAPYGSPGVLGTLANIQREVGSLSAVSAAWRIPTPMNAFQPSAVPQMPVPPQEVHRRAHVVQGWTAQQSRKRQERSVMLGVMTALLLAVSAAIVLYYFVPIRVPRPIRPSSSVYSAPNTPAVPVATSTTAH
jgi:serine/threonine-protein kinase